MGYMVDSENRRRYERIALTKPVEATPSVGKQGGEIKDISAGGAAIVSHSPLKIKLGEPVELRVENFGMVSGRGVRVDGHSDFAIAFDLDANEALLVLDGITKGS